MLAWLKDLWGQNSGSSPKQKEVELFVQSLKPLQDEEIGMAAFLTVMARKAMEANPKAMGIKGRTLLQPHKISWNHHKCCSKLRRMIDNAYKQGNQHVVVGATPWLHTMRATKATELRPAVCEMWQELSRGFPYIKAIAHKNNESVPGDFDKFPEGFEPYPGRRA